MVVNDVAPGCDPLVTFLKAVLCTYEHTDPIGRINVGKVRFCKTTYELQLHVSYAVIRFRLTSISPELVLKFKQPYVRLR